MIIPKSKQELIEWLANGTAKLRREVMEVLSAGPDANEKQADQPRSVVTNRQFVLHKGNLADDSEVNRPRVNPPSANSNPPLTLHRPIENDDSVIDVSGESVEIPLAKPVLDGAASQRVLTYSVPVSAWPHHYVYSDKDIQYATAAQQSFYKYFSAAFIAGGSVDLDDNSNYAFVLMFDLFKRFKVHGNLAVLKEQIERLGQICHATLPYSAPLFAKELERSGDVAAAVRFLDEHSGNEYNYWKLGKKYREKLNLTPSDVVLLNLAPTGMNGFLEIEFCLLAVCRLYLAAIRQVDRSLTEEGSSFETMLSDIVGLEATKASGGYGSQYDSRSFAISNARRAVIAQIFRLCENAARRYYSHGRRLGESQTLYKKRASKRWETTLLPRFKEVLETAVSVLEPPDLSTEKILNRLNPSRWRGELEVLKNEHGADGNKFAAAVQDLGIRNAGNPRIALMFLEAAKYIAGTDKEKALLLYLYHAQSASNAADSPRRDFPKKLEKQILGDAARIDEWRRIVDEFEQHSDLAKAAEEIADLFRVKRKRIDLDRRAIDGVLAEHSGTVELLNEYLDDEADESRAEPDGALETAAAPDEAQMSAFHDQAEATPLAVELSGPQRATIEFFTENGFEVGSDRLAIFAKEQGTFPSRLVDGLNETFYEFLDDVLIEEDGDCFTMNEEYLRKVLSK